VIDLIGGPGRDRTDDLFHAMEARSQTAPQAHTGNCNFSIVSGWADFVKRFGHAGRVNVRMVRAEELSLEAMGRFVARSEEIRFEAENRQQVYGWIEHVLVGQALATNTASLSE
jgi:hypothetical protein